MAAAASSATSCDNPLYLSMRCAVVLAIVGVVHAQAPRPGDGGWSQWTSWTSCSADCKRQRVRYCSRPIPSNGGRNCLGESTFTEKCSTGQCARSVSVFEISPPTTDFGSVSVFEISPPTTDFVCGADAGFGGGFEANAGFRGDIRVGRILGGGGNFGGGIESGANAGFGKHFEGRNFGGGVNFAGHGGGGIESRKNAWPWMALLHRKDKAGRLVAFCSGVLINRRWVLTAAHCTNYFNVTMVRLGEHDVTRNDDGVHEDFGVAEVKFYPGYQPPKAYHDISLIRLTRTVNLRRNIRPACLPWGNELGSDLPLEGNTVTSTGWGGTVFFGDPLSPFLNEIDVTILSTDVCAKSYSTFQDYAHDYPQGLGEETLCIGDPSDNEIIKDNCPGDSGGPANLLRGGSYIVVGIVSHGFGCGKKGFPGLYVNIQYHKHLDWIKKVAFTRNWQHQQDFQYN